MTKLEEILAAIEKALKGSGRSDEFVQLIAVSKRQPNDRVRSYLAAVKEKGLSPVLGENYVQEYESKREELPEHAAHLIGPLQSNKAKKAVELFSMIQSLHSRKLALALEKEAKKLKREVPCLLQVNVSGDPQKSGFPEDELLPLFEETLPQLDNVKIHGFMTITQLYENPEDARPDFVRLHKVSDMLQGRFPDAFSAARVELSMGMSSDYMFAVEEGATMVRVGSALFGERPAV